MPVRGRRFIPTALSIVAVLVVGCGDDTTEPQTGNIRASIIIDGAAPDPDGCLVSVDGGGEQVLLDGEGHIFGGLSTGTHMVAISDVAFNCFVRGEPSRPVTVSANETSFASFTVDCPAPGRIEVATGTAGSSPFDPDGYTVSLDGGASLHVGVSDAVTFPNLAVGEHEVELTNVADNCAVFAEDSKTVTVAEGEATAVSFGVACPPFYDHIAFTRNSDIWVMRADGSNPVNLTNDEASSGGPAWSPDGTRIAFTHGGYPGPAEVYVLGADGSNPVNLTNHEAEDREPAWSPDGTRIAFESLRDGDTEIYVMNADGSNPVNLTNHEAEDVEPAWSPDGTRIAFTTFRDGDAEIYLMDPDGSNTTNITDNVAMFTSEPDWSPDGTQIVFWTQDVFPGALFVMGADGSNPTHVITESCMSSPAWSPDGLWIAFSGYCGSPGGYEVMVVQADGSNLTNLTNHGGHDSKPAWSPTE